MSNTIGTRLLVLADDYRVACGGGIAASDAWGDLCNEAAKADAHEVLACACAAKQRAQIRAARWQALYGHVLQEFRWMKHSRFTRLGRKLDAAQEALEGARRIESTAYVEWSKVNE